MTRLGIALACAALLAATPLAAQEPFIEGVYLSAEGSCDEARRNGIESAIEAGGLALTASGLHGYEYHCDFLQVLKGVRTPGWTVTALCEEPDFAFSDLITILPRNERQIDLTSLALRSAAGDDAEGSAGSLEHYVLCEGVVLP